AYERLVDGPDAELAAHAAFNAATLRGDPAPELLEVALGSGNPVIREEAALRLAQFLHSEGMRRLARAAEVLGRGLEEPPGRGPDRLRSLLGDVLVALGDPAAERPLQE